MIYFMDKYSENRKYSIIDIDTKEFLDTMKKNNEKGLCFNKFKTDFVFDGDIKDLNVGDKINIDGIDMIITQIGKACYQNECELYKKSRTSCKLKENVAFAK